MVIGELNRLEQNVMSDQAELIGFTTQFFTEYERDNLSG